MPILLEEEVSAVRGAAEPFLRGSNPRRVPLSPSSCVLMPVESFPAAPERISDKACSSYETTPTAPLKTPIQILNEFGIKTFRTPVYTLEKAEGQAHNPHFTFRVTIGDISCLGDGPSKKVAKQNAAEAALNVIKEDPNLNLPTAESVKPEICKVPAQPVKGNPVGLLQELAVQRAWRLPEYTVSQETGPPHNRVFTMSCRVENFAQTGASTSKKVAKKIAAEKLLAQLQSIPSDEIKISKKVIGGNQGCTWDCLKNSSGEKINLLRKSPLNVPNTDYVAMLKEVAEEKSFAVSYIDLEELNVNGQHQCLAELSTNPVTICHGTGLAAANAHNDAAHNALQYLKIMASKK